MGDEKKPEGHKPPSTREALEVQGLKTCQCGKDFSDMSPDLNGVLRNIGASCCIDGLCRACKEVTIKSREVKCVKCGSLVHGCDCDVLAGKGAVGDEKKPDLDFSKVKYVGAGYAVIQQADSDVVEHIHTPEICKRAAAQIEARDEALKTILSHAGSAIECCDEPGKGYLREVCEIVDLVFGIDTSEEEV